MDTLVDVLIPTYNRPAALAVTLTSLISQSIRDFNILISDQTEDIGSLQTGEFKAVLNVLHTHGNAVGYERHLPRRGMAEQRQFLLEQAHAPYVLFLDDDLILEPWVIENLLNAIQEEECGFTGSAVIGLSYVDDVRPGEQKIEFWNGPVQPEQVRPGTPQWERYRLHNAANLYHIQRKYGLTPGRPRKYKVAWIGGCILYDRAKLLSVGGFSFWKDLPVEHAGEDVLAQLRVMDAYGGCGLVPSGVYHQELPTTLPNRSIDAPKTLTIDVEAGPAAPPPWKMMSH